MVGCVGFFRVCFIMFGCLTRLVVRSRIMKFGRLVFIRCFLVYFLGRGVGSM